MAGLGAPLADSSFFVDIMAKMRSASAQRACGQKYDKRKVMQLLGKFWHALSPGIARHSEELAAGSQSMHIGSCQLDWQSVQEWAAACEGEAFKGKALRKLRDSVLACPAPLGEKRFEA